MGDYKPLKWAEKVARFFVMRGRNVSVEITDGTNLNSLDIFADMGCHLIFYWYGMKRDFFTASSYMVNVALTMLTRHPGIDVTVRYIPIKYTVNYKYPELVDIETSLELLLNLSHKYKGFHAEFSIPKPWSGEMLNMLIETGLYYLDEKDKEGLISVYKCGNVTITPNTNIYPCQYLKRSDRAKFFGNADREVNVIGTLRRGVFRKAAPCNKCAQSRVRGPYKKRK